MSIFNFIGDTSTQEAEEGGEGLGFEVSLGYNKKRDWKDGSVGINAAVQA